MTLEIELTTLAYVLLFLMMWPAIYVFLIKGREKIKFVLASLLISLSAAVLSQFVLLPLYFFAKKIGPQLIENGISTVTWLFVALEYADEWSFVIVLMLLLITTPIMLFKYRSEYHLTNF